MAGLRYSKIWYPLLALLLLPGSAIAGASMAKASGDDAVLRPIIAEVHHAPDRFVGRKVVIYGLVLAVDGGSNRFDLIDVSDRTLSVVNESGVEIGHFDEVQLQGTVRLQDSTAEFVANAARKVQVIGAGGCC